MNDLRLLVEARPVLGCFVKLPRPEVIDVIALAGFDFAVVDYEHSQMGSGELLATIRSARSAPLPIVVRIPEVDRGLINRLLEAGAVGIQLARTDATAAVELGRLVRYPPQGTRSLSLVQPAGRYGLRPLQEYIDTHNANVLAVGQFETKEFASSLDEAVEALDVIFIGPMDLSVDLGHPGDLGAGPVQRAIAAIEAAAKRAATPMGIFVSGRAEVRAALERGHRYIVVSSDLGMLMAGARQVVAELQDAASAPLGSF